MYVMPLTRHHLEGKVETTTLRVCECWKCSMRLSGTPWSSVHGGSRASLVSGAIDGGKVSVHFFFSLTNLKTAERPLSCPPARPLALPPLWSGSVYVFDKQCIVHSNKKRIIGWRCRRTAPDTAIQTASTQLARWRLNWRPQQQRTARRRPLLDLAPPVDVHLRRRRQAKNLAACSLPPCCPTWR